MGALTQCAAWQALEQHFTATHLTHMRDLFETDPARAERFSLDVGDVYLDYSKNRITDETLRLLMALARETGLPARIKSMFKGEKINTTENRSALHVALRNRTN